ncbi:hypothetical protein GOV04_05250 [Candidatus Woesearchaeota archaeon]|nr:hypothetical protein [Candidatus Woesearchaeota archaeon]
MFLGYRMFGWIILLAGGFITIFGFVKWSFWQIMIGAFMVIVGLFMSRIS